MGIACSCPYGVPTVLIRLFMFVSEVMGSVAVLAWAIGCILN
jgi:phage shock protein PspC (stress-responsive transcriptional regulator)